ncbi:MAG TPA: hypothetical protein VJY35_03220 [Candidatus Eisenbacteria bacterium]|nr:hypothetical protein [Candidatus Eisenbacteria bacterium]
MKITHIAVIALVGSLALLTGCKEDKVAEKYHPAKLEDTAEKGISRVILEARAAERIGLRTAQVREEQVRVGGDLVTRKVVPYGAIMYDTKGETWTFTNPSPLTFVRHRIVVEDVQGDQVILAEGPAAGTAVVTVGAAELMGAEHKYGH